MPFSGVDDERLPTAVQEMPADDQKQWVATYNKFYLDRINEGNTEESCDQDAYAVAYAAVDRTVGDKIMTTINEMVSKLAGYFATPAAPERSISVDDVWWQVADLAWEMDGYAFLTNLYFDDDNMFAVFAQDGKLYRAPIRVSGTDVSVGDLLEVQMEFTEVPRSMMTIRQLPDGRYRWIGISASSVLNRVGEIDSKEMFDSFIDNIAETGEYPLRMFYHMGEQFRTGQCDFVGRDGNLLITSGLYDDTEIALGEVHARQADPDYWGDSIGFVATEEPTMLMFDGDIEIPVYRQGILNEISTVPEAHAASWMTAMPTLETEVNRMLNDKQFEVFVKLFEDDEDEARAWLEKNADSRNRAIVDGNQITRDNGSEPDSDVADEPVADEENLERDADVSAEEDDSSDNEEDDIVFELDDAAMDAIAERVSGNMETIAEMLTPLQEAMTAFSTAMEGVASRLETLEESDEERHQRWTEDTPRGRLTITHRPSIDRGEQPAEDEIPEEEEEIISPADVALEKLGQLD